MDKYFNFAIVLSFFSLWLISLISLNTQTIMGFTFIFSFGILHGANDLKLIYNLRAKQNTISIKKLLIYYVVVVLIGVFSFYLVPIAALLVFIIVSGYHFGEQQWQNLYILDKKWFEVSFKLVYGVFILFLLFNFHRAEVQNIILAITEVNIPLTCFPFLLKVLGFLLFMQFLYLYIYVENLKAQLLLEVFYLVVFAIIFLSSSLIWGFAIFFIIWHSIPSMMDQIKFLYQDVTFNNFKLYCKSAFLYWIASLIGIALLYFFLKDEKMFNALFFSFLAAITFPHALVILKMFGRKT